MTIPARLPFVRPARSCRALVEPLESRIAPAAAFPLVSAIERATPTAETTGAGSVVFKVTFDANVTGVDAGDFKVFTSGDAKADAVVSVATTGSAAVYDVTVSGLRGNGDVRLDLVDNDTIKGPGLIFTALPDSANGGVTTTVPLGGTGFSNGSFTGDAYHLLQTAPTVASITKITPSPTEATSVSWTVTFSEAVTGVDAADFNTVRTNTLTAPTGLTVTPNNPVGGAATSYKVETTGTLSGLGDITLNLKDNFTIKDSDGNPLQAKQPAIDLKAETTSGTGVALATGDLNSDGKADVVTLNAGATALNVRLGNGDGTYTDKPISGRFSKFIGVAIADVNGDGKPDLLVAGQTFGSSSGNVSVALGNDDGTFQTQTEYGNAGDSPRAIKVSDLNGDGRQDIVLVANSSGNPVVSVLLGNTNGTFQPTNNYAAGIGANSLAIGDLDADGDMDVVTANSSNTVSVLLGNGTGGLGTNSDFTSGPAGLTPVAVALGDLNGDGRPDIVVGNASGNTSNSVTILLADATPAASFTSIRTLATGLIGATDVAVADYNGDGFLDIASAGDPINTATRPAEGAAQVAAINGAMVNISFGSGTGTFLSFGSFPTGGSTGQGKLVVGDFNGDGKADLAGVNSTESMLRTLLNLSPGDFEGEAITRAIVPPDLTVTTVSDAKTTAMPGDTLTYTITYKNLTSKDASGVTLTTQLDPNLDFISSENTGWNQSGSTLVKVLTSTVPGNSADLTETLKLHVKTVISGGYSGISTTTTISDNGANGTDPNTENNRANDYDTLTGLTADVSVTAIDDPELAISGQTGTYTVHLKNTGNSIAYGQLAVTLPAGVNFSTAANPTWTYDSTTNTIKNGTSVAGGGADQTVSFTVTFFPKGSGELSTTALYTVQSQPSDSNTANNQFTEKTPIYSGYTVTSPGVAIAKRYAPPVIRVFDRLTGGFITEFFAYEEKYRDSVRVAVGDINGDGIDDIITTTSKGTGRLRVFDGSTFEMFDTGPYSSELAAFTGKRGDAGAFVTVGDFDGNGTNEIAVGNALGGGKVKIFAGAEGSMASTPALLTEFFPFGAKFKGGVRVAAGDVDGASQNPTASRTQGLSIGRFQDDLVVGQGYFGGGVKVYKGLKTTGTKGSLTTTIGDLIGDFAVGGKGYRGGVSVAVGELNDDGHGDLIIGRNSGKPGLVELFDGSTIGKTIGTTGTATGLLPDAIGQAINPFGVKNKFGVRVAAVDLTGDGIAEIIATVGVKNGSQVKVYDSTPNMDGTFNEITDRHVIPVYPDFKDVALWIAGSRDTGIRRIVITPV